MEYLRSREKTIPSVFYNYQDITRLRAVIWESLCIQRVLSCGKTGAWQARHQEYSYNGFDWKTSGAFS